MVQRALLNDSVSELAFVSDRTHGCSSIDNGAFEIMLHRRCAADDGKGVGETLNETTHIEASLMLTLTNKSQTPFYRKLGFLQQFKPIPIYGAVNSIDAWPYVK